MFTSVPAGWQSEGRSYAYTYTTLDDIGEIHRVDIVHSGGDQLCIDHIKVNGVEYDENGHKWIDMPHCIEDTDGGGCDTVTIILPTNSWSSRLTIPCEYQSILHDTYQPTPQPTDNTRAPSVRPTDAPSPAPTDRPTDLPSVTPTISPTSTPTTKPTRIPSESPTESPTAGASSQVVEPPPEVSKNGGVEDLDGETDEGGDQDQLINSTPSNQTNGMLLGAIIGGLTGLILCLCGILLTLFFCWRQRRNMKDGMQEVNAEDPDEMNLSAENAGSEGLSIGSAVSAGTGGLGTMSTNRGGQNAVNYVQIGVEDENAEESDQHEEEETEDEGLYDHHRRNMTQRIDLDEDDDVVPE